MSIKEAEFDKYKVLEEKHWWFVGTREICFNIFERYLPVRPKLKILDIGCGTGGNIKYLSKYGEPNGLDVNEYAIRICKSKGLNCSIGNMADLNLPRGHYDLITFFDVINQAPVDTMPGILKKVKDGLSSDGIVVLREPALKIAGGGHDTDNNIQVRFNKRLMESILREAGLEVLYMSYINTLLFLPIVVKRKKDQLLRRPAKSDMVEPSGLENLVCLSMLRLEKKLLDYTRLPFGVSLFVVARKVQN